MGGTPMRTTNRRLSLSSQSAALAACSSAQDDSTRLFRSSTQTDDELARGALRIVGASSRTKTGTPRRRATTATNPKQAHAEEVATAYKDTMAFISDESSPSRPHQLQAPAIRPTAPRRRSRPSKLGVLTAATHFSPGANRERAAAPTISRMRPSSRSSSTAKTISTASSERHAHADRAVYDRLRRG